MSSEHRRITLTEAADGRWTAHDERADVTAHGDTRTGALDALDEAIEAAERGDGDPPALSTGWSASSTRKPTAFESSPSSSVRSSTSGSNRLAESCRIRTECCSTRRF